MIFPRVEGLNIGAKLPIMNKDQRLVEVQTKIDPFKLPPIRDVYEPLIRRETVRFNPFDGEVYILGQRNDKNQIAIDKLDPQKGSSNTIYFFTFRFI